MNNMICPRCGSEMNSNSRYCMKCGYLNPNDPANQNIQQYIPTQTTSYQVGAGVAVAQNNNNGITNSIASNTGNKKVCFLINYLIYMSIIILSFFIIIGNDITSFDIIKNSLFPYVAFITSIVFLFVYSLELIFMKCNKKWWNALIPIYNLFILSEIVYKKKMLGIVFLIPIIGQIFLLVTLYKMGDKFQYSGLLSMLFPVLYVPLMGFGSRLYEGVNYIGEERTLEKDYTRKRIFIISLMIFLIFGFVCIYWTNIIEIKSNTKKVTNYYYVYATKQIIEKTKILADENYLECDQYQYNPNNGKYYIEYADMGDIAYFPFYYLREVIGGYVIIDNTSGSSKYYISISDGTYGYPETLSSDVKLETIVPYERVNNRTDINYCRNIKHKATTGEL